MFPIFLLSTVQNDVLFHGEVTNDSDLLLDAQTSPSCVRYHTLSDKEYTKEVGK